MVLKSGTDQKPMLLSEPVKSLAEPVWIRAEAPVEIIEPL